MLVPGYFTLSASAVPVPESSAPSLFVVPVLSLSALSMSALPVPGSSAPCLFASAMLLAMPGSSLLPFSSSI